MFWLQSGVGLGIRVFKEGVIGGVANAEKSPKRQSLNRSEFLSPKLSVNTRTSFSAKDFVLWRTPASGKLIAAQETANSRRDGIISASLQSCFAILFICCFLSVLSHNLLTLSNSEYAS